MENLEQLAQIDWWYVIIAMCLVLVCVKFLWSLVDWVLFEKLKVETGKMKQQREDRELLKATTELAKTTAENLDKLQLRHTVDEEEFRNNLNSYIEESRKDRKILHDEMSKLTNNRVNDRQQSIQIQKELKDSIKNLIDGQKDRDIKIENLTSLFISKDIDDMRWEILNFCSALTSGRKYNKESFDHVIQIHEKYEKVLKENNMENGRVTASMEVIMDVYKEKLKNGF